MRDALKALISLYPKPWRKRYQTEFAALLDDVPPTWRTFFNVLGGALAMQLKVWSPWKIIAASAAFGALAAAAYTLTIPKRYVSEALIRVQVYGNPDAVDQDINAIAEEVLSRSSLVGIMMREGLYQRERSSLPVEDIVQRMRREDIHIRAASADGSPAFTVAFAAADAASAQRVTGRLASAFIEKALESHAGARWELRDGPGLPAHPDGPRLSRNMTMGLMAGILAGALFALFNGLKVWKLAAALGVAGLVLGAAVAYVIPTRYSSMAVIQFRGPGIDQLVREAAAPASLDAILRRFNLYPNDPAARTKLRANLHFLPIQRLTSGVGAMAIQFDYGDRQTAQEVTRDVVASIIDASARSGTEIKVTTLDPASLAGQPTSPNRAAVEAMGVFAGLAGAVLLGLRRYYRRPFPVAAAS